MITAETTAHTGMLNTSADFEPIPLKDLQKRHVLRTYEHFNRNKTRTAQALGVTIKSIYIWLHAYGLEDGTDYVRGQRCS